MFLCIGVDVGGTNTDAVILKGQELLCWSKVPTTSDVTSGVASAIKDVITKLPEQYRTNSHQHIGRVNIGTTHFINAIIQRKGVAPVAVLRLCGPASRAVPPFADFPTDLKNVMYGGYHFLNGGFEYNGKHISALDVDEVKRAVKEIEQNGIRHITVSGVFSLVCNQQEDETAQIIQEINSNLSVTLSHEVGLLGLLERENAAILNESLKPLAQRTVKAFHDALNLLGLKCPLYLTQNDGTVISAKRAMQFPVFTFSSGSTNSMRGATFLCDVKDAIVIDIGGTTTDVGVVLDTGFPRQASTRVKVGGVNTNFRIPDVLSIGLGGGSHVKDKGTNKEVEIGPESVGYKLLTDARIFGGNQLTVSDIAVAGGLCDFGDKKNVENLNRNFVENSLRKIREMTEDAVDQVKVKGEDQCVILVGGGSVIIDEIQGLKGASSVIKPKNCFVANAVGAALSQVSGTVDYVCSLEGTQRDIVTKEAEQRAREKAIDAGAVSETVKVVDKHVTTLTYLPGDQVRLHFTAVGDLADTHLETASLEGDLSLSEMGKELQTNVRYEERKNNEANDDSLAFKEPTIDPLNGDWLLSAFDINCIAVGAGVLGCGGGGNPYIGKLIALQQLAENKEIRVIHPDRLGTNSELTGLVAIVACMGAPTIVLEKLLSGKESLTALAAVKSLLAAGDGVVTKDTGSGVTVPAHIETMMTTNPELSKDTKIVALSSFEIGGMNSMVPLCVAAKLGLPVVDADGMGRAFPEVQMFVPFMKGEPPYPMTLADEKGGVQIAVHADTAKNLEDYMRVVCVEQGCLSAVALPLKPDVFRGKMVLFSMSRAWKLGCAIIKARQEKTDPIQSILIEENGQHIITGKISDVSRRTERGFTGGWLKVEGSGNHNGKIVFIDFQNENLLAYTTKNSRWNGEKDKIMAVTPDLITIVDADTGEPITTELLRYGLRVAVLALPCSLLMRTEDALKVVGPSAFRYEGIEYRPLGNYRETSPIPRAQAQHS